MQLQRVGFAKSSGPGEGLVLREPEPAAVLDAQPAPALAPRRSSGAVPPGLLAGSVWEAVALSRSTRGLLATRLVIQDVGSEGLLSV